MLPLDHGNAYEAVVAEFLKAIQGEGAPGCSGGDGLASLRCALAAEEAIASGRMVEIAAP